MADDLFEIRLSEFNSDFVKPELKSKAKAPKKFKGKVLSVRVAQKLLLEGYEKGYYQGKQLR